METVLNGELDVHSQLGFTELEFWGLELDGGLEQGFLYWGAWEGA